MKPTKEQQSVIDAQSGAIMVKACPGSGKTATLVKRVMALPREDSALVLAFNTEAAKEFTSRLGSTDAKVMTFHSFCFREILKNPYKFGFKETFDGVWQGGLFNLVKAACGLGDKRSWQQAGIDDEILKECSSGIYDDELEEILSSDRYQLTNDQFQKLGKDIGKALVSNSPDYNHLKNCYEREKQLRIEQRSYRAAKSLRKFCLDYGYLTYDDMVRLVAENRHELIGRANHIMVDEFQDVDRFQFDIIDILGRGSSVKSIAVVGDPNQLIYEWRGALKDSFGTFKKAFPDAVEKTLTKNFRSVDPVIEFSDEICPVGMSGVRGNDGGVFVGNNRNKLMQMFFKDRGLGKLNNYAILHRTNAAVEATKRELIELKIPFFVIGKSSNFWNQRHVKLALNFRNKDLDIHAVYKSDSWLGLVNTKKYRDNDDAIKELKDDVSFIFDINMNDIDSLQKCTQNKNGVVLSTMHRTKGMEWENVFLTNVDSSLKNYVYLYYVACTRAKNNLFIHEAKEKE